MSITTKTGDKGKTGLFGGERVSKADPKIETLGAIDETTSFIGFAVQSLLEKEHCKLLTEIQTTLYLIMGILSGADVDLKKIKFQLKIVEDYIVKIELMLPELTQFILPQGSETSARFHLARVMVRSAERRMVAFAEFKKDRNEADEIMLRFMNRLSDLFFLLARVYTKGEKLTKGV